MSPDPYVVAADTVDLPWGKARVVETVHIAWQHHHPSLELLELPDGRHAVRFAAFHLGRRVDGPLVLDEEAVEYLARALHGTRVGEIIRRLGPSELEVAGRYQT